VINKIKADTEGNSHRKKNKSKPSKGKAEDGDNADDMEMKDIVPAKKKGGDEFPETTETYMIFVRPEFARAEKETLKDLNVVLPVVPQFLDLSDQWIGWG
jgi:hypothetical protein